MKRYSLFIFCVLLCLSLAACKKPVGSTPYESTDSYVSSDVESDEQGGSLESDSSQLPQGDSSNSTTKGTTSKNTTTKSGSDNEVVLDWGEPEPTVVTDSKGSTVTDKNGKSFDIPADSVILSTGYRPAPLAEKAKHVHIVGDASKVGNLRTVIWGAWDVAMKL